MLSIPWPVRYGFSLAVCLVVAASPWVMTMLYSPLPPDLRVTATALSATRTAREAPHKATQQAGLPEAVSSQTLPTFTASPTSSPTISPSSTPTIVPTSKPTSTATPEISGIANETVNAYSCPGRTNRQGELEVGSVFVIMGWDEVDELKETATYLLIENDLKKPQKWIKDSEYLLLAIPNYKDFIPHLACRR
jgi:hypothetical protein